MGLNRWSAAVLASLMGIAGCGDDDEPAREAQGAAADGKIGTSDPDTPVAALNAAEWTAACADMDAAGASPTLAHGPCIMLGLLSKFLNTDCMATYQLCMESPGDLECDEQPTDCQATLRELDDCLLAQRSWLADVTKELTCESSLGALAELPRDYLAPACRVVTEKCPSLELPQAADPSSL
jgi:hypothetical protein